MPESINMHPPAPTEQGSPALPETFGLTLEQARELIARHHETLLRKDDPELMLVTLFNAYLAEIMKVHERHEKGLGRVMVDKTDGYVQAVQKQMDGLVQSLSSASVEGIRAVFKEHAAGLQAFKSHLTWLSIIVASSAVVNVVMFVLLALRKT